MQNTQHSAWHSLGPRTSLPCKLLLLRWCWKMRLRNKLGSHLLHLFQLGQIELSTAVAMALNTLENTS